MDGTANMTIVARKFRHAEEVGFRDTFTTPYTQHKDKEGQPFKVLRRCTLEECDLECLPMWWIRFPDGTETCAFSEEIIKEASQ